MLRPYAQLGRAGQAQRLAIAAKRCLAERECLAPLRLKLISHQHNTGFRADTPEGRFFLRLGRTTDRTPEQVADEAAFLAEAGAAGIVCPVPQGIFANGPERLEHPSLDEPRLLMRFSWLDGRAPRKLRASHARDLGRTTAKLHQLPLAAVGAHRWRVDGFVVGAGADTHSGANAVEEALGLAARRTTEAIYRRYEDLRPQLGPIRLLHGDLHPWNCLWNDSGIQLLDFDDCGWGPEAYDLCVPLRELREIGRPDLMGALLDGYQEVRPLPPGIPDALPLLYEARAAQLVAWVARERHTPGFEWWEKWSRARLGEMEAHLKRDG